MTLPCRVKDLGPLILLWKKGDRVLTAGAIMVRRNDRFHLDKTNLRIENVQVDDRGDYVCQVETDDDEPISIVHSVEILGKWPKLIERVVFAFTL